MGREYPLSLNELLREMHDWCKLMENGYIGNSGAALNPVDAYNLMSVLDEARDAIIRLRRIANE